MFQRVIADIYTHYLFNVSFGDGIRHIVKCIHETRLEFLHAHYSSYLISQRRSPTKLVRPGEEEPI